MQTKKMSLANIQGKLSRAEMKKIMAGSGNCNGCTSASDCRTSGCGNRCSSFNGINTCWWSPFA